ncbi:early nodulin-like protein 1 [Lactuca sativa]|uniref:Phytocyanin domain-containing protein n=1 Tax=Lactuca sativa TaxID=4236 RepID=A0A9R1W8J8_LACSA|nr:early nodulin-like protein 1 [Lactuca sativa]KAJ0218010.1 hypothetical protein LSAT_V11C300116610 [Lactuca sativa]
MEHQMNLLTSFGLLFIISAGFFRSCYGYTFHVGGKNGWVIDPRESYNHWAERNRFQVNDTLVFKYKKGMDSVLVVNEEAYHNCNKTDPKETLNDGYSVFKFTRSGPFFFISGHDGKCENGEKLWIVVMAVSHRTHTVHSTAAPPTPASATLPPTTPAPPKTAAAPMPSAMLQGTDKPKMHAPAPATSGVASTAFGGWVGLILGLGLVLGF